MKMKVVIALLIFTISSSVAGPGVYIAMGGGRGAWCGPGARPLCGPIYSIYPTAFSPWIYYGNTYVSTSGSFSNVSPVMNYLGNIPVYKVPAPVLPAQPVTVYPDSTFSWKK